MNDPGNYDLLYPSKHVTYDVERRGQIVTVTKRYRQPINQNYVATISYPTAAKAAEADAALKNNPNGCYEVCYLAMEAERKKRGEASVLNYPGAARWNALWFERFEFRNPTC